MGRHGTIAGRKAARDSKRAASFTKYARLITVAAKAGGRIVFDIGIWIIFADGIGNQFHKWFI